MSTYIQAILQSDFDGLSDTVSATEKIVSIYSRLKNYFHLESGFELEIEDNKGTERANMPNRYRVVSPFHGFGIEIGNGFIIIDSCWSYSQYFYISNNRTWLRDMFFDFVTALGYEKAIVADEYHGWNHAYGENELDMFDCAFSFSDWKKEFPAPPEIVFSCFHIADGLDKWPEIENLYIDDFKECFERKKILQECFKEYTILTIGYICGGNYV